MSEDIDKIIEDIKLRTEKFGAYLRHVSVAAGMTKEEGHDHSDHDDDDDDDEFGNLTEMPGSDELKKQLISGDISVIVFTAFSLNELAFSDRVQSPEKVRDEDEFKAVAPSEFDILQDRIRDRLSRGLDPFSDDD